MSEVEFKAASGKSLGLAVGICAVFLILFPTLSPAQAVDLPTSRPLLDELNHETQTLFKQVASSIVRVQMPLPTNSWLPRDDPLAKWAGRLDPVSLARLEEIERASPAAPYAATEIHPTTIPSTSPSVVEQSPPKIVLRLDRFSPNGIGIVLDDENRLLIPRYVDRAACQFPIPVSIGDGRWATASFVASDRQADLTVLRIIGKVKTKSAMVSASAPEAGALLLVMSLNPAVNRLTVWEGWEPDVSTLVNIDGTIAGFTKGGHFLSAAACGPVVTELIEHGVVRRAFMGVVIETVATDDPERQLNSSLGAMPALRISQIIPGSPAERAGLQPDDLILRLAGASVGDAPTFAAAIANRRGSTRIDVLRKGQLHVVNVVLQVE
jgi:S1-C subfamily serine protease